MTLLFQSIRFSLLLIISSFLLGSSLLAQQVVFQEDFESYTDDADFVNNSQWSGDLEDYTLVTENGNQLLRLDNDDASGTANRSQLRAPSSTAYGTWEFSYRAGTSPTTANRGFFFLVADDSNLNIFSPDNSTVSGYAIRTGSNFELIRITNGNQGSPIISSSTNIQEDQEYRVRVTRTVNGDWQIYVGLGFDSTPQADSPVENDNVITSASWFGFLSLYSSGNSENFFYDNFIITEETDDFLAENIELTRADQLDITFNNNVDEDTAIPANFNVDLGVGNPTSAEVVDGDANVVRLTFSQPFDDGDYTLTINNLQDEFGQQIEDDTELSFSVTNTFDVETITAISSTSIEVVFTEVPDGSTLLTGNFSLTGDGVTGSVQPESIDHTEGEVAVTLNFSSALSLGDYELTIDDVLSDFGWPLHGDNVFPFEVENPFFVTDFEALNRTTFEITFSQDIQSGGDDTANYSIAGIDSPQTAEVSAGSPNVAMIEFADPLDEGSFELLIENITSVDNWQIDDGTTVNFTLENLFDVDLVELVSPNEIRILFNETPDEASLVAGNFDVDSGIGQPQDVIYDAAANELEVFLEFSSPFFTGDYILTIGGVQSDFGWPLSGDTDFDFMVENPFTVTDFETDGRTDFLITFSLDVDSFEAADFSITGTGSPDNTSIEENNIIRISYNDPVDLGEQELVINNITSVEGWEIEPGTSIEFILFDEYEDGDLVISEFYYRTPASWRTDDIDRPRYVEIYNRSDRLINLRDFTMTGVVFSENDMPIAPDEYLVLTVGVDIFEERFGERNFVEVDDFPSFSLTTSSSIVFETNEGELIEELTYVASTWGGNEVSLERLSFDAPAGFRDNWAESEDALTGSPGLPNTVTMPTDPPEAVAASFPAPRTFHVTFSRTLSEEAVDNLANFSLNNNAVITSAEFTSDERTLAFTTENNLEDLFEYTFAYQDVEDIFGNEVPGTQDFAFTFENPFRILSAELDSEDRLVIRFTLPTQTSTISASDFQLGDGTEPVNANVLNSETVELTFSDGFDVGSYEIIVNDIASTEPSIGDPWELEENSTVVFFKFDEYQPGDIVLNEFMYRPPSGYPRYVELHNQSDRFLNLRDWELRRAAGSPNNGGVFSQFDLPIEPGGFVVITPNATQLEDIFGEGPWIEMSNYPGLTTTVGDRIRLIDADGDLVEFVDYEPSTWGGNGVALERRSLDAPVNDINNWGESEAELLGTPGAENSIGPLDEGPQLISADFLDAETIRAQFTGALDFDQISEANFSIDGGLTIAGVTFSDEFTAELSLDDEMISGTTYTLTVTDIPDIFGNVLDQAQRTFTYFFIEAAEPGDVVINEFMYNEPDDYTRYIELYNRSDKAIDLAGWQQANDTGTRRTLTNNQTILAPDSYIVITPNEELLNIFPGIPILNAGSSLSALKNGGDEIVIVDSNGTTIDSLRYSPDWGGNGVALERRRADRSPLYSENWAESPNELLGTPGSPNEVDSSFELVAELVEAQSRQEVRVVFNAGIRESDAVTGNFSVGGTNPSEVTIVEVDEVLLEFSSNLSRGQRTLTINNLRTRAGFQIASNSQFSFTVFDLAQPGDIVVNEFMYRPPTDYPRYVELYNRSNRLINLKDWEIRRRDGAPSNGGVFSNVDVAIGPGEYVVVTTNAEQLDEIFGSGPWVEMSNFPGLTQTVADQLRLLNSEGELMEAIDYVPSSWGGNRVALERRSVDAPANDINNWGESLSDLLGTPGEPNTIDPLDEGPQLTGVSVVSADTLNVQFAGAIDFDQVSIGNFSLSGGVSISSLEFTNSQTATLVLGSSLSSGTTYTLTVTNIPDIFGNVLEQAQETFTYFETEIAEPGDVVINEFMYNEPEGYTRYIELYNQSSKAISLAGWLQANDTGTRRIITNDEVVLPPDSYIVILPNEQLLDIFPEIPFINAGGRLSALKNGGDNIVIANAEGTVIDSLRYSPDWGGNGVALERRRADRSSLYPENWDESPSEELGTPAAPNEVDRNFTLAASDIRAFGRDEVQVTFNASIRETDVVTGNFSVNGSAPSTAEFDGDNQVRLLFSSSLSTGEQTLTINNIRTLGGFQIADNSQFTFAVFDEFEDGDIVINEFMYRPPSGYARYVELFNHSEKIINLRNWRLQRRQVSSESPRIITERDLLIGPGEFVVITDDAEVMTDIFGEHNYVELSNYPSFTVTVADQIRLFTNTDLLADSLEYVPSEWGGNGVALERLNPDVPATLRANWAESPNELLGTPGLPNEAQPDPDPPVLLSADQFRDQGFILRFDKELAPNRAMDASNYSISPNVPISMVALDGNNVILFAGDQLINDQVYDITVSGISDIFGNVMESVTISVRYLEFSEVQPGQIVINEILYRRLQSGSPEFVEIFNRTDQNFDLSGWTLSDASGSATIPMGTAIRENDYLVFTDIQSFADQSDQIIYLPGFQSLSNTADAVVLRNGNSAAIDSVFYQASWYNNPAGVSLERRDPGAISIDRANWAPSTDERGSTPAEPNSQFEPDVSPPEIIFANVRGDGAIEVIFSEFIDLTTSDGDGENQVAAGPSALAQSIQNHTRFLINGSEAALLSYDSERANRIVLDGSGITLGEEITLVIENLGDFQGNITTSAELPVSQPLTPGDLVFNEIMYNPIADSHDGLPDQSDYIEIHNRRPYAISLEGIFLHDEPDENGGLTRIDAVTTTTRWIPGGGYALFYPEPDARPFTDSRTARFFEIDEDFGRFALRANRTTLSLPNAGRQVYLADSTGATIDMVDYSPDWHNPNLVDTRGIALERINPDLDTNNPSNWGSSATPQGGTPGRQNSLFQTSEIPTADTGVFLDPNPFSPDGSGFEDNLFINYQFDEPDYMLRIRIYDRYGRLVRTLVEGENAGFEGTVIWDGRTDNGLTNRIGIYIVLVEAFNSASGRNLTFKETAVIARQF